MEAALNLSPNTILTALTQNALPRSCRKCAKNFIFYFQDKYLDKILSDALRYHIVHNLRLIIVR